MKVQGLMKCLLSGITETAGRSYSEVQLKGKRSVVTVS